MFTTSSIFLLGIFVVSLTIIAFSFYHKVVHKTYPPILEIIGKFINWNPNGKSGTWWAWVGGADQDTLQTCTEKDIQARGTLGFVMFFTAALAGVIGNLFWSDILGEGAGLAVGWLIFGLTFVIERVAFQAIDKSKSSGKLSKSAIWTRIALLVGMALFDTQMLVLHILDEKIKQDILEEQKLKAGEEKTRAEAEIAGINQQIEGINTRRDNDPFRIQEIAISKKIDDLDKLIVETEALAADEVTDKQRPDGKNTGVSGRGAAWQERRNQIAKYEKQRKELKVELDAWRSGPEAAQFNTRDSTYQAEIAVQNQRIAEIRKDNGEYTDLLTDVDKHDGFLQRYEAFIRIMNQSWTNKLWCFFLLLVIMSAYSAAFFFKLKAEPDSYNDQMAAEAAAAKSQAVEQEIIARLGMYRRMAQLLGLQTAPNTSLAELQTLVQEYRRKAMSDYAKFAAQMKADYAEANESHLVAELLKNEFEVVKTSLGTIK